MSRQYTRKPNGKSAAHATWIVAADAGRARLFRAENEDGELTEIDDLLNADARLRDLETAQDRNGHTNSGNRSAGNSFEPRQWHLDHAAEVFARGLSQRLSAARRRGEVDRLYIIADPGFLGLLRKKLDRPTLRIVAQQTAKDFTRRSAEHIRNQLPKQL
jgi:protein required for attachment to host cells